MMMLLFLLVWLSVTVVSAIALVLFLVVDDRQVKSRMSATGAAPPEVVSGPETAAPQGVKAQSTALQPGSGPTTALATASQTA